MLSGTASVRAYALSQPVLPQGVLSVLLATNPYHTYPRPHTIHLPSSYNQAGSITYLHIITVAPY